MADRSQQSIAGNMAVLCLLVPALIGFFILPATAADTPTEQGVFPAKSDVANLVFANAATGAYYFKFNQVGGGGINALHISSNAASFPNYGDVTTTGSSSGTFYITETGGRGYQDEAILLVAVLGEIPDNFAIHIKSSGYSWTPTGEKDTPPTEVTYREGAVDETFTKSRFVYGPQTWKPAGNNEPSDYPLYFGQDTTDTSMKFKLMFVDLKAGPLGPNADTLDVSTLTDKGAIRVEYTIENLDTVVTFNTYAWNDNTTQGQGISWTNGLTSGGDVPSMVSGYTVLGPEYRDRGSEFPTAPGSAPVYRAPDTAFTANVTAGAAPLTVQFTDTTAQSVKSWSWDFGDGSGSTEQNPVHTYTDAGTYTVALTAANGQGMTATKTEPGYIRVSSGGSGGYTPLEGEKESSFLDTATGVAYPVNFTANVTTGSAPLAVRFSDISGIPNSTAWSWDFNGDGVSETTGKDPVYIFRENGNYTVNLTLTTAGGARYSGTRSRYIRVSDAPVTSSGDGWISSDLPAAGAESSSADPQPSAVPTLTVAGAATQVMAGSSPLGTKIAEVLFDSFIVIGVIGGGFFLWKKV